MADTQSTPTRSSLSVRTRFEVFKRDEFQCRYCGRRSPEVVLQVDHVVPVCEGGTSDSINLVTSCWECNSGKSGVPLDSVITAEDPTERAILLMERERQLQEYNHVLATFRARRESEAWDLIRYWTNDDKIESFNRREFSWLVATLDDVPMEQIRTFMDASIRRGLTRDFRYVKGCVRNQRDGL